MGKYFLIVALVFGASHGTLLSQEMYAVRGTVYIRDGKSNKVNLSIYCDEREKRIPVDINGDFVTRLNWNNNYLFRFSKPGYVSKQVDFSTSIPSRVDKKSIYPYQILVELFPIFPNADTTFFKNPVAKIKYCERNNDFDYDLDYQLVVKENINKFKNQYLLYRKKGITKPKPSKEVISKTQEITALRYQKSVETEQRKGILPPESKVARIKKPTSEENPFGLPPIKEKYPEGKTIEIHELKGKIITRVIIKNDSYQKVFYKVKHNWGGLYYFVQEAPTFYRSISKYNFEKATKI